MTRLFVPVVSVALVCTLARDASAGAHFLRGDANRDSDTNTAPIDIADGIAILSYLFTGGAVPPCLDAADVDDSGEVDIGDGVNVFNFLFLGGRPPAAPYPQIDADPTADVLDCAGDSAPIEITGEITANRTLERNKTYKLVSGVFVRAAATLTIQSGVTIMGDPTSDALLVIDRGAKLIAVGNSVDPVVFTSAKPVGERKRGDWGGVIILGRGDLNAPGKEADAEGLPPGTKYGGGATVIPDDSSGKLSYVKIEFGGTEIAPDNEVNGLSLFAVGSGTEMDHIQIRFNLDDGVEWFGGAASLKYGIMFGISDDSFDYSFGFSGKGQFWVAQQRGDEADRGFEVDNSESDFSALPLTHPVISNVTLIGDPDTNEGTLSTDGILLRRGCGTQLYNAIVQGFKVSGVDIDDGITTNNNPTNGNLIVDYSVFYQNGPGPASNRHFRTGETGTSEENAANGFLYTSLDFGTVLNTHNTLATVSPVVDPYNLTNPNFRPQNDALSGALDPASLDPFFQTTSYRGAVPPIGNDWTKEAWISYAQN